MMHLLEDVKIQLLASNQSLTSHRPTYISGKQKAKTLLLESHQ